MFLLYFPLLAAFFCECAAQRNWFAIEGEAFVMECQLSSMTWYLGDTSISTDKEARMHSSGRELWFLPAFTKDSGNYTCVDSEDAFTEINTVTIYPRRESICYHENMLYSETVGSPGSGKIYCPTFDYYRNASAPKWYKDCKELHGSRYRTEKKMLLIHDANVKDIGKYTCLFTYRHGNRTFNVSATRGFRIDELSLWRPLTVQYPQPNEVIKVKIGFPKNLSCKAILGEGADTVATSYWENNVGKDPKRFVRSSQTWMEALKKQVTEAILQIKEVQKEDLGLNFTCYIANDMGYKRVNVTLCESPSTGNSNIWLIVAFVIILVVLKLLGLLYYLFRVDITLLYRRIFKYTESSDDGKIYDAYVINPTNLVNSTFENNFLGSFVHQILPEVLEKKCGYKLCIYGRDVLPGEDAINAVEKRIQKSRRLIILLTECLAKTQCFMYEHQIAFYSALIQNDVKVILLEMEGIGEYTQLQESLKHLIHQRGTIKWKTKYMARPASTNFAFWKHVEYQMPARRKSAYVNL
ncbi:interleukin-1 receptor-like 1 [Anolis sagrei]|uniref:interleukin-1 receptor-like 1 n=1 Tax=Anolis sagrei TaxID=38937 RepID=UPI003522AF61